MPIPALNEGRGNYTEAKLTVQCITLRFLITLLMNIDLRQCRHVLALDQSPQLRAGRGRARLTQPALTRSLQVLEKSIGARLFDRNRARVEPTPVGERLIERARLLVNQARDIEQDLKQMLGLEVGLLRIGAGPYPADLSVGTAIGRLVKTPSRADGRPVGW